MPEIENTEPHTARRRASARTASLWVLGFALILGLIGALLSNQALSWGLLCFFIANFLNTLTAQPTPRIAERWRRPLQLLAGLLAVTTAVTAFTAHKGAAGIFIGAAGICLAVVVLTPAIWPTSRERFPRFFGGTR